MDVNAWGDNVGVAGILSIGIMVAGIFCLMVYLITKMAVGVLLKKLTGRENAITRWMAAEGTPLTYVDPYPKCPYCHWDFHPRVIDWHIREKHGELIKES